MSDDLYRLSDFLTFNRNRVDRMVMQFHTLQFLRREDDKRVFLARTHGGTFNFCGIQVREDLAVPFNTVIFKDNKGTEVGRITGIGAVK